MPHSSELGAGDVKVLKDQYNDLRKDALEWVYRREGGDPTDWSVVGTTVYTPPPVRQQVGSINIGAVAAGASGTAAVGYPVAFSNAPLVFIQIVTTGGEAGWFTTDVVAATLTGFTATVRNQHAVDTITIKVFWLAVGPE